MFSKAFWLRLLGALADCECTTLAYVEVRPQPRNSCSPSFQKSLEFLGVNPYVL